MELIAAAPLESQSAILMPRMQWDSSRSGQLVQSLHHGMVPYQPRTELRRPGALKYLGDQILIKWWAIILIMFKCLRFLVSMLVSLSPWSSWSCLPSFSCCRELAVESKIMGD